MEEVELEVTYTNSMYDSHYRDFYRPVMIPSFSPLWGILMIKKRETEGNRSDGNSISEVTPHSASTNNSTLYTIQKREQLLNPHDVPSFLILFFY